jgi:hypothetical protein
LSETNLNIDILLLSMDLNSESVGTTPSDELAPTAHCETESY